MLVVAVQERPTISSITFVGNKEFDTDTVKKALRDIGLAEARIFDRSALERAEQELKRQYITRGLYSAKVQTTVTPQERNRVAINFTIDGGRGDAHRAHQHRRHQGVHRGAAAAARCTLDHARLADLVHEERPVHASRSCRPTSRRCAASTRTAAISSSTSSRRRCRSRRTRRTSTITVNVTEGPRYTVSDVRIAGDLVGRRGRAPPADPRASRATRSRARACRRSAKDDQRPPRRRRLRVRQRQRGARASTATKNTASFTFFVDPGRRVYVRKVNISGNPKTRDEVIRREVRQLEGAWYDGTAHRAVEGAHPPARLLRAGHQRRDAAGARARPTRSTSRSRSPRRSTGNLLAGVGYSSADGVVFNASVSQQNVFGSGNALALSRQHEQDQPHATRSRSPSRTGRSTACRARSSSTSARPIRPGSRSRSTRRDTLGGALGFGVPVTETDTINFGVPRRAHRSDAVRRQPAGLLRVRQGVRQPELERTSCRPAGRVTPATTSSILRAARLQSALRRDRACRSATSSTTRRSTSTSRSGRSTATSC